MDGLPNDPPDQNTPPPFGSSFTAQPTPISNPPNSPYSPNPSTSSNSS